MIPANSKLMRHPLRFASKIVSLTLLLCVQSIAWGQDARGVVDPLVRIAQASPTTVDYGPHAAQAFDVYLPASVRDGQTMAPIIVMVHGGAWRMGDKSARGVINNKVERWVSRGFVFVSVGYRLLPVANPLEQAQDVARALAHIQKNAVHWGADAKQLVLMGHSAGGHLVSLLGADPARAAAFGVSPWLGTISLDSAALDVESIMRDEHHRLYDDAFGAKHNALWRAASPIAQLTQSALPTLLVCSNTRAVGACPASHAFSKKLSAHNVRAEVLEVSLNHMQINASLGERSAYTREVERFMASLSPRIEQLLR